MTAVANISPRAFVVWFRDLSRWSVGSFVQTDWRWPVETIKPLSVVLSRKTVDIDRASAQTGAMRLVTLHFDGEMEPRDASAGGKFKGRLFHADPGDVIYSKIDVRNGSESSPMPSGGSASAANIRSIPSTRTLLKPSM